MLLLSIIIPVYNVEAYIGKLLQSIFSQDTERVEIIVVNDGTPDDSMNVVQGFVSVHANLHIVNQPNRGLSEARDRVEASPREICLVCRRGRQHFYR